MQNEWLGFEQVTNVQMLEKVDTSYSKKDLPILPMRFVICLQIKSLLVKFKN